MNLGLCLFNSRFSWATKPHLSNNRVHNNLGLRRWTLVMCASLIETKLWLKGTVDGMTAEISALVLSIQSNEGWHGVVGDTALMRWGVAGREEGVKSDLRYRERDWSWKVNQTKDSDGTSDLLGQDQLPPKESCESYCANSAGKKKNWPEPKNFNESQMWAEATSWTEGPNKAATADIFFQILTRWGQYCFLRGPV